MRLRLVTGFFLVGTALLMPPLLPRAHAQIDSREYLELRNQIDELAHEVQQLQDQVGRGGGSSLGRGNYSGPQQLQPGGGDLVAQLLTRVEALEDQVRQLRGRVDENQNALQRQGAELGKRIDDLAFQISPQGVPGGATGGARPAGSPATPPAAPPGAPANLGVPPTPAVAARLPSSPSPRTPEAEMREGNAALARHDYAAAEQAARAVLANRTSPLAYDAHLLLARSLAGEHQFAQAAIAFDDTYNASRKGSHAQEALLGLASSLTAIKEKKAACDTLVRLRSEFPQPRADVREETASIAQRAGCH